MPISRIMLASGVLVLATLCAGSAPLTRAMVLSAHGARFFATRGASPEPLRAGKVLVESNQIAVDAGGDLVILDLAAGKRLGVKGAGLIVVGPSGLEAKSGNLVPAAAPGSQLTASGENFRRLGGVQLRAIDAEGARSALAPKPVQQSLRYRGLQTDCSSPKEAVLTFRIEKGETTFLGVDVAVYAVNSTFNADYQSGNVTLAEPPPNPLYETRALADADETTYHVRLDRETFIAGSYRLRISEEQCGLDVRTGFRIFGAARLAQIEEAARARNESIAKNPRDLPNLLADAVALQELYELDEAHTVLARARALEPDNDHLRNWDFELLLDSGHYAAALQTLVDKS